MSNLQPFLTSYLARGEKGLERWQAFRLREFPSFSSFPTCERATPFWDTDKFAGLSPDQRDKLYVGFVQMHGELFIHFEQMLLLSSKRIRRAPGTPEKIKKLMLIFEKEELAHVRAFRRFLISQDLDYRGPKALLLTKSTWIRWLVARTLTKHPYALFLPGSRLEVYSLEYFRAIYPLHKEEIDNPWVALNELHAKDEVLHIPLDYHFLTEYLATQSSFLQKLTLTFTTFVMFLSIQALPVVSGWRMLGRVFPGRSLLAQFRDLLTFLNWLFTKWSPYPKVRAQLKKDISNLSKHFYFRIFRIFT